ncbi:DUF1376 domain-containing protein [Bartonella schoenbuchensis]|uniref:Phage related protein n=1 Tax=Bartonella schoenbuchensis m07a TaxID=1094496 RepID=N6ULG3_9HYPH|nr:DUF1376 domain-containing protein [Bartonella schoenbuchensis]ENN91048.1 hypothetical protein m07a_10540 [Bartonella schoenbuchensis m07a]
MATQLPWVKFYPNQFLENILILDQTETAVYTLLLFRMIGMGEHPLNNVSELANWCGCSEEIFQKTLQTLMNYGYIIRLEDGSLWHTSSAFDLDISNTSSEK